MKTTLIMGLALLYTQMVFFSQSEFLVRLIFFARNY